MMINGRYIKLRAFEIEDLEASKNWINDPEIAMNILRVLPVSMHEHVQWYEKIIMDKTRITFAIISKNGKYIGNVGLMSIDWRNRKGNLWIYLEKKVWGKGYGKEAIVLFINYIFNSLNLNKVYLDVGEFNKKAISMYKSLGFKSDGILREDVYLNGQYINVLRMSILNHEASRR